MNQGLIFYGFRTEILRILRCNKSITISSLTIVKLHLISADQTSRMGRLAKWTYHNSGWRSRLQKSEKENHSEWFESSWKEMRNKTSPMQGRESGWSTSPEGSLTICYITTITKWLNTPSNPNVESECINLRQYNIWQNIRNQSTLHKQTNQQPPAIATSHWWASWSLKKVTIDKEKNGGHQDGCGVIHLAHW